MAFRLEPMKPRNLAYSQLGTLSTFGYNMLCFPLDRHHIREYVKQSRALLPDPAKGPTSATQGRDSKLR